MIKTKCCETWSIFRYLQNLLRMKFSRSLYETRMSTLIQWNSNPDRSFELQHVTGSKTKMTNWLWTLFHFVKHRTGSKMMCHSVVYTLGIYECPHNLRAGSTDDKMSSKSIWCAAHPLVRSVGCLRLSGSYVGQLNCQHQILLLPPPPPPFSPFFLSRLLNSPTWGIQIHSTQHLTECI